MELLLVIAITLIISAISLPLFVRSVEGNQLTTAARSVNRMHRYARAMSVLKGTPMVFAYNATNNLFTVSAGTNTVPLIKRELAIKVSLEEFTVPDNRVGLDELPSAHYTTSGQCLDYSVTLSDTRDKKIIIKIDGIAGSVRFEDQ